MPIDSVSTLFSPYETVTTGDWGNSATPAPGQLYGQVFESEILTRFVEYLQFAPKVRSKSIATGTKAKFPATWKLDTTIHDRGEELFGQEIATREYEINLESRPVVSTYETDDLEQDLSYYDVRSELAAETGRALAKQWDIKTMYWLHQAATYVNVASMAGSSIFPAGGGATVKTATLTPDADGAIAILDAVEAQVVAWENGYVPQENRYCAVTPAMWYAIKNVGMPTAGTNVGLYRPLFGSHQMGLPGGPGQMGNEGPDSYIMHNGVAIFRTPWLADTSVMADRSSDAAIDALYRKNYSDTSAILFQEQAVGTVMHTGIKTEMDRDVRRQTDFTVSKMFTGGGILRPQCAAIIKSA
jgi:hypothetical protein